MPPRETSRASDEQWHLDKRVPITLIITILVQTAAAIWWASSIAERVGQHDRQIATLVAADMASASELRRIGEVLGRLDERMAQQHLVMQRLEQRLDRIYTGEQRR